MPWRPPPHLMPTDPDELPLAQTIAVEELGDDFMDLVPTVTGAPFSMPDPHDELLCGPDTREGELPPMELNEKQFARVILRRDFKTESLRKAPQVKQASRQEHALRRPRGPAGRFLKAGEEPAKPPPTSEEAQARLAIGASAYSERKASVRQRVRRGASNRAAGTPADRAPHEGSAPTRPALDRRLRARRAAEAWGRGSGPGADAGLDPPHAALHRPGARARPPEGRDRPRPGRPGHDQSGVDVHCRVPVSLLCRI